MKPIQISTAFIKLGQFLKLANCISSGGEVKLFLEQKTVKVNGTVEQRRGRKLYPKDIVYVSGFGEYEVI